MSSTIWNCGTEITCSALRCSQAVRKSHRGASTLVNRIPHNLVIESTSSGLSRLYFLSVPPGLRENTLLYIDYNVSSSDHPQNNEALEWHQLLDSFQPTAGGSLEQMSKEEQLLRERKRLRSYGITGFDYQLINEVSYFAFSAANSVFVCSDCIIGELTPVSN